MSEFDDLIESYTNYLNLWEGLIKTNPIEYVEKEIGKQKFDNPYNFKIFKNQNQGDESATASIVFVGGDIKRDLETLKSILNFHGFHIGSIKNVKNSDGVFHKISIEPKFSRSHDDVAGKFYHVTTSAHTKKINKIGLTPRSSKSSFDHPGNRVYLFKTKTSAIIEGIKDAISKNRLSNIPEKIIAKGQGNVDWYVATNQPKNMVAYEVDVSGLKLFEDPLVAPTKEVEAYYTIQNIPPEKLKLIS